MGFSSCGSWAELLHGMWDLPRPGIEPVSPALAGGFLTTAPPGKCKKGIIVRKVPMKQFHSIIFTQGGRHSVDGEFARLSKAMRNLGRVSPLGEHKRLGRQFYATIIKSPSTPYRLSE